MAIALLVILAIGGTVAGAAMGNAASTAAADKGRLIVSEKVVDEFGIYEEGAIAFLRLRRVADGETVVRRRYSGRIAFFEEVPARRYKLISFVRPCSGNCGNLDPPTDRCTAEFRLPADSEVKARIVTNDGEPCRIRFPEN